MKKILWFHALMKLYLEETGMPKHHSNYRKLYFMNQNKSSATYDNFQSINNSVCRFNVFSILFLDVEYV
jgi:hypothetical protein